jgi:hypothetical protein
LLFQLVGLSGFKQIFTASLSAMFLKNACPLKITAFQYFPLSFPKNVWQNRLF